LDQARRAENKLGLAEHLADASGPAGVSTFALALLLAGAEPEELATAVTLAARDGSWSVAVAWAAGVPLGQPDPVGSAWRQAHPARRLHSAVAPRPSRPVPGQLHQEPHTAEARRKAMRI
jgi:hypothetical protein